MLSHGSVTVIAQIIGHHLVDGGGAELQAIVLARLVNSTERLAAVLTTKTAGQDRAIAWAAAGRGI